MKKKLKYQRSGLYYFEFIT